LGLAVVTGLPSAHSQPVAQKSNTETGQNYSGPANATNAPAPVNSVGIVKVNPATNQNNQIANDESTNTKPVWWNPDAWVAVFTLILSGSTILLWMETRRLAKGAEKATLADLRPWVSVKMVAASDLQSLNDQWVITPKIIMTNHGKTPAISTKILVAFCSDYSEITEIQDEMIIYASKISNSVGKIIFPDQKAYRIDQVNDWQFKNPGASGFKARKLSTGNVRYIFGVVVYNFFDNKVGITKFSYIVAKSVPSCHIMIGVGYGIENHETRVSGDLLIFHPWPVGNDAQ
jgi:hypothetical protein